MQEKDSGQSEMCWVIGKEVSLQVQRIEVGSTAVTGRDSGRWNTWVGPQLLSFTSNNWVTLNNLLHRGSLTCTSTGTNSP